MMWVNLVGCPVDQAGLEDLANSISNPKAGTRFALVKITAGDAERVLPPRDGVYLKNRFRSTFQLSVN